MFLDIEGQCIYRCFWIPGITFIEKAMGSENLRALAGDDFLFCEGRRSGKWSSDFLNLFMFSRGRWRGIKGGKSLIQYRTGLFFGRCSI